MRASDIQSFKSVDTSPYSATVQWLADYGFNPHLAEVLEAFLANNNLESAAEKIAARLGRNTSSVISEMEHISFRVPSGFSFVTSSGLGSAMDGGHVQKAARQRAFELDSNGRPKEFEPSLMNILILLNENREKIFELARGDDRSLGQRVRGYLYGSLAKGFQLAIDELNSVEETVLNLQGLVDALKFKLSLPDVDTAREAQGLNQLLTHAIELREFLVKHVHSYLVFRNLPISSRWEAFDRIRAQGKEWEQLRRRIKSFCSHAIDESDRILGYEGDLEKLFMNDTPWELYFYYQREVAKAMGLKDIWLRLRTFQIIQEERHYTAHWTTTETTTETDNEGNSRTVTHTVDHYSSSDEVDHETIPTPPYELKVQKTLEQISREINSVAKSKDSHQIQLLREQLLKLKTEHALYGRLAPQDKDESPHKLKRVMNQQAQIRSLLARLQSIDVIRQEGLAEFSTAVSYPEGFAKLKEALTTIDRTRHRRTTTAIIGTAIGAGAVGAACGYFLTHPGGVF